MKAATKSGVGYARVSSEKQAERGISLDAQLEKIRAMATVQEVELLDVIVDGGESAKTLNRPGMERLLALVDAKAVSCVIVTKLDRLTRSVRDLGELLDRFQRRKVTLVSVSESLDTGTAAGRLVLNIMASVSQWEREAIGDRTREVLRHKRAKGERAGNVPYGFSLAADGKTLLPNEQERAVLAIVRDCHTSRYPLRHIASELNRRGLRTRSGAEWRHQYVAALVKSGEPVM
jgi:DNA invertase Pin-like site-specific DNA recombinase